MTAPRDIVATRMAAQEHIPEAFADLIWDPIDSLAAGFDFKYDTAYMTIPLQKIVKKERGKGKNKVEYTTPETRLMLVGSDHSIRPFELEVIQDLGYVYPKSVFTPDTFRWHPRSVQDYVSGKYVRSNGPEVFAAIRTAFATYVEYADDVLYDIMALYVMQTYIFRLWRTQGYIHFNGTKESGKSRNLDMLRLLGFNPTAVSDISSSGLFRTVEGNPGVILVDEAEDFKGENGEQLRRLLLAGYTESGGTIRVERDADDKFTPIRFATYSPKAIASIAPLDSVLGSRSIVVGMVPALRRIPELDMGSNTWQRIRNELYIWALDEAVNVKRIVDEWNDKKRWTHAPELINRQWQVSQPYFALCDYLEDMPMLERIAGFFNDYFAQQRKSQDDTDRIRLLLKALPRVLATQTSSREPGMYLAKAIHDVMLDYIEEDQHEYYKINRVNKDMSSLGFTDRRNGIGGMAYRLEPDRIRAAFRQRRIAPHPEDVAWLDGADYHPSGSSSAPSWMDDDYEDTV
jgi:hypothetical protein